MEKNPLTVAKEYFAEQLRKGKLLSLSEIKLEVEEEEFSIYHNLLKNWYDTINQLSFLPNSLDKIEEIFIHSTTNIQIKSTKGFENWDSDITNDDLNIICDLLVYKHQLDWNYKEPFVSFYSTLNGCEVRVSMIHYSTNPTLQSKLFIRVLNQIPLCLSKYHGSQNLYGEMIHAKKNVLIAGATGSGKTTFANAFLKLLPEKEHVVIIEDTKELISTNHNTTRMIVDPKNENKSMNNYLSYSLRMSPDRIILGEIRSKEAESSLLAMNTGHKGFVSTIHANSAKDALHRLSLLFKMYSTKDLSFELVLKLITTNIDYVIFIEDKQVKEIIEVFGSDQENIFYETLPIH